MSVGGGGVGGGGPVGDVWVVARVVSKVEVWSYCVASCLAIMSSCEREEFWLSRIQSYWWM